jgi:hypothetical protein
VRGDVLDPDGRSCPDEPCPESVMALLAISGVRLPGG